MYSATENAQTYCVLVTSRSAEVIMHLLLSIVVIGFAFVVVLGARSFVRDLLALTRGGIIGLGDVQWMTAGRGILHEEFHSYAFGRTGVWTRKTP
jgi:hypothetical protein